MKHEFDVYAELCRLKKKFKHKKDKPSKCVGGQSHMVMSGSNKCMVCGKRVNRATK